MRTTGYALREAIKQQELRRDTAAGAFDGSLKKFPGEDKDSPHVVMETFSKAELALAQLQVAQMKYNLAVTVEIDGTKMCTLAEAIKRIGGAGRIEKMWKSAIGEKNKRDIYGTPDERDTTSTIVRAERTVTVHDAVKLTTGAGKKSGAIRAAIAVANGKEVEIENLDPALFE